ncbi:LpxL/LpxP family Kdo(2)-lipid IV(A) lauroyl/palmitoleoyl acyltransferase [Reinekea thalattae]|uniref:LpxL/LpxP family Kdo(2)-lipid IV(A) lauroyl/palmitoleoyl acyltransferase n=1 Tax=Reinekea thalattae TaxID=2593301 RepID=A0A5C8Z2K9_9GAMM|nr:LpxL/LpxP family Kdo(2)-lipid IV(A) lauroyl/palmitoleoyl acyltransferase [Reinekea thalattae]TXR51489.1 LpxL/LpxP family Kdo(2)-lipid IV(A) lauroyl/palmitoleoyl acyltransferase [Reinekea thalattae]
MARANKKHRSSGDTQKDSHVTDVYRFRDFLAPRYWKTWISIAGLYSIAWLPIGLRSGLSVGLAAILKKIDKRRLRVVQRNLELCFPEKTAQQRAQLLKATYHSYAMTFIETAHAWCRPVRSMHLEIQGREYIDALRSQGRGAILVSGHFAPLDIAAALLGQSDISVQAVYRKDNNPLFNYFMTRARERYAASLVARKDIRGMIKNLKQGGLLWYAPDQDYGRRPSIFVPFFGVQAATITKTSVLAEAGDAAVVPMSAYRTEGGRKIVIRFEAPLNIPSGDERADAICINQWLETRISEHPEQYLWFHKRFKTRPEGEASLYD